MLFRSVTYFEKNNTLHFYLKGGLGSTRLVINSLFEQNNIFMKYLSMYFENINGLSVSKYGSDFYFEIIIDGDIENIISQISEEDLNAIIKSKKYNI